MAPSDDDRPRLSATRAWWLGIVATAVAFVTFAVPPALRGWTSVPSGTDTVPYTNMGVQLARGHGLAEDLSDPLMAQWFTLPQPVSGGVIPTTRWPPLFPLVMSGVFRTVGFDLGAARVVNCFFMALACGLAAGIIGRRQGLAVALTFVVVVVFVDERVRASARALMTEPLAAFLVTASAFVLMRAARRLTWWTMIGAGALLGAAILTRTIVALWMPGLALLVIGMGLAQRMSWVRSIGFAAVLGAASLVVCLPWFAYNIRMLGAFMPLGSHVYTLPSGWSDGAWERGGTWESLGMKFFEPVSSPDDPPMVRARKNAEYGRARAVDWIVHHPVKAPILALRRAVTFWTSPPSVALLALLFPLVGLLMMRPRGDAVVIATFLVMATAAIAATWIWEVERMQAPTLPLLHYGTAVGIVHTLRLRSQRSQPHSRVS